MNFQEFMSKLIEKVKILASGLDVAEVKYYTDEDWEQCLKQMLEHPESIVNVQSSSEALQAYLNSYDDSELLSTLYWAEPSVIKESYAEVYEPKIGTFLPEYTQIFETLEEPEQVKTKEFLLKLKEDLTPMVEEIAKKIGALKDANPTIAYHLAGLSRINDQTWDIKDDWVTISAKQPVKALATIHQHLLALVEVTGDLLKEEVEFFVGNTNQSLREFVPLRNLTDISLATKPAGDKTQAKVGVTKLENMYKDYFTRIKLAIQQVEPHVDAQANNNSEAAKSEQNQSKAASPSPVVPAAVTSPRPVPVGSQVAVQKVPLKPMNAAKQASFMQAVQMTSFSSYSLNESVNKKTSNNPIQRQIDNHQIAIEQCQEKIGKILSELDTLTEGSKEYEKKFEESQKYATAVKALEDEISTLIFINVHDTEINSSERIEGYKNVKLSDIKFQAGQFGMPDMIVIGDKMFGFKSDSAQELKEACKELNQAYQDYESNKSSTFFGFFDSDEKKKLTAEMKKAYDDKVDEAKDLLRKLKQSSYAQVLVDLQAENLKNNQEVIAAQLKLKEKGATTATSSSSATTQNVEPASTELNSGLALSKSEEELKRRPSVAAKPKPQTSANNQASAQMLAQSSGQAQKQGPVGFKFDVSTNELLDKMQKSQTRRESVHLGKQSPLQEGFISLPTETPVSVATSPAQVKNPLAVGTKPPKQAPQTPVGSASAQTNTGVAPATSPAVSAKPAGEKPALPAKPAGLPPKPQQPPAQGSSSTPAQNKPALPPKPAVEKMAAKKN